GVGVRFEAALHQRQVVQILRQPVLTEDAAYHRLVDGPALEPGGEAAGLAAAEPPDVELHARVVFPCPHVDVPTGRHRSATGPGIAIAQVYWREIPADAKRSGHPFGSRPVRLRGRLLRLRCGWRRVPHGGSTRG